MNAPLQNTSFETFPYPTAQESRSGSLDALFLRVESDDYQAFEAIFKRTYRSLCTYASGIVRDHELAEELVDDVFCNLWRNRKRIQINASFRSYLIASVRNKAFDYLRKSKNRRNSALDAAIDVPNGQSIVLEEIIYEELNQRIEVAIQALPRQCRTIFQMSRNENLRYKEIAAILRISIKTVDTQMGRALKYLRKTVRQGDF
jgi:RNA polymerase sigma-70 factor (ECF subfamily)